MRKSLVVGILRETKDKWERRSPLAPSDARWLIKRGIEVEIQSSSIRIFKDSQFKRCGAHIVDRFKKASFLLGVKEPKISELYKDKIYLIFSHSTKGQSQNMPLLKECISKRITLVDYEKITDAFGRRLVYFGRFAGICGLVDSLYYLGRKLEYKGIINPFLTLKQAYNYHSLKEIKQDMIKLGQRIHRQGFDSKITPFIFGLTGHGNVSQGVREVLELLHPIEVHPKDMLRFIRHQKHIFNKIYKIGFHREEKFRSKKGRGFYFEDYLNNPQKFESNMDIYLPYLNILIHASYWDARYPRLVTKKMIDKLYRRPFRLEFIGDISCDINGSIELTYKATTVENPTFTYNPKVKRFVDGYKHEGISILARDNLPAELPLDASRHFGGLVRDYVYQIALHGRKDITNHVALARELRQAVITQGGKLTKDFRYLKRYL